MTYDNSQDVGGNIVQNARRLKPEASRMAALNAAKDLLIEAGPQAVTLKAVAMRIGRTHANLLHHFGSAAGLQKALSEYLAETIVGSIGIAVAEMRGGKATPSAIVDMIFDAFDKHGGGALAAWMLLSGNEDALNPILVKIHGLVDTLNDDSEPDGQVAKTTLEMILLALGDALLGTILANALGLDGTAGRQIATVRMTQALQDWRDRHPNYQI